MEGPCYTRAMKDSPPHFVYPHPKGLIQGWCSETGLTALHLPKAGSVLDETCLENPAYASILYPLKEALEHYFTGAGEDFGHIPLDIAHATPFHQQVWRQACATPFGQTATYGELARQLGLERGAARAVGRALGANPIAILIPCHRFIAADGKLVNYAAGLEWKEELLRIEGAVLC